MNWQRMDPTNMFGKDSWTLNIIQTEETMITLINSMDSDMKVTSASWRYLLDGKMLRIL